LVPAKTITQLPGVIRGAALDYADWFPPNLWSLVMQKIEVWRKDNSILHSSVEMERAQTDLKCKNEKGRAIRPGLFLTLQ
jgi:hypothetical protein